MKNTIFILITTISFLSCSQKTNEDFILTASKLSQANKTRICDSIQKIVIDSIVVDNFDAVKYYKMMYRIDSLNPRYFKHYSEELCKSKKIEEVFTFLNTTLLRTNNKGLVYYEKGFAFDFLGTTKTNNLNEFKSCVDSAMYYYTKALNTDSTNIDFLLTMYQVHNKQEKYDLSLKDIEKAIRLLPDNKDLILFRGVCKKNLGKYDEALIDLKEITDFRKKDPEIYFNRAVVYLHLKMYAECIADCNTCETLGYLHPKMFLMRGNAKSNLSPADFDGAFKDIKKSYEMGDQEAKPLYEKYLEYYNSQKQA